jgi:hypothetical protein
MHEINIRLHNNAAQGDTMSTGKWTWTAVTLIGFFVFSACALEPDAGELSIVNNAQISYDGDSATVTGVVDGELTSINASEIVADGTVMTERISAGSARCYVCVCSNGACVCREVPCPVQQ